MVRFVVCVVGLLGVWGVAQGGPNLEETGDFTAYPQRPSPGQTGYTLLVGSRDQLAKMVVRTDIFSSTDVHLLGRWVEYLDSLISLSARQENDCIQLSSLHLQSLKTCEMCVRRMCDKIKWGTERMRAERLQRDAASHKNINQGASPQD